MWHFSGVTTNHNPTPVFDSRDMANTGVIPEAMLSETGSGLAFM